MPKSSTPEAWAAGGVAGPPHFIVGAVLLPLLLAHLMPPLCAGRKRPRPVTPRRV